MTKLKRVLWLVVFLYIAYALYMDGPSTMLISLLVLALLVLVMQLWMKARPGNVCTAKKDDMNPGSSSYAELGFYFPLKEHQNG